MFQVLVFAFVGNIIQKFVSVMKVSVFHLVSATQEFVARE